MINHNQTVLKNFLGVYLGYGLFYLTRYLLAMSMPLLFFIDNVTIGSALSIMAIMYGISKFAIGIIADQMSPKRIFIGSLFLTSLLSAGLAVVLNLSEQWLSLVLNIYAGFIGFFQGAIWPGCSKILMGSFTEKERGTWWGIWNTCQNVGVLISAPLFIWCANKVGISNAFIIPSVIAMIGSVIVYYLIDESVLKLNTQTKLKWASLSFSPLLSVLVNPMIWMIGLIYFLTYFVKSSIIHWMMTYSSDELGYTVLISSFMISVLEIGGAAGAPITGWLSDNKSKSRISILILYQVILIPLLISFTGPSIHAESIITLFGFPIALSMKYLVCLILGMIIFSPQMLLGVVAAETVGLKHTATATGFIGAFGYLGVAFSGGPIAQIIKLNGWNAFFMLMIYSSLITMGCIIILRLWVKHNMRIKRA
ncbi:MFS transporter [Chlamydiia bacterium]|nr:MFS transporter [Chlamydiia bacterium]